MTRFAIMGSGGGYFGARLAAAGTYRRFLDQLPAKKEKYLVAEHAAKTTKRGIWQGEFIMPSSWRNQAERLQGGQ